MPIAASLLPEYDHEMAATRRTLERIPEGKSDYKPHEKSMAMGKLGFHLATLPNWCSVTLNTDALDLATMPPNAPDDLSTPAILAIFDQNTAAGRAALEAATDDQLMGPWSLQNSGHTIFTMPRIAVLRSFVMNHVIHHRAQLGVYLRLNDVPVPSVYGPTADEGNM